ncbi:hypothetical protein [Caloramator australicus]|uniref:DUF3899 domain-containing protein n=1 Tax=Caloramator australicus RC3 TaxID=857293 RepID=I7J6H2_9CLOT|nr:hypothetical protein [Caloramator australicus]CCJ34499.1 hypothetical protein CAAU_2416 [Caloramator australicus RC3]
MKKYILKGIKESLIYSLITAVFVSLIATIFSLIKGINPLKSIYISLYAVGIFASIFSIPQLFKRDEDPKIALYRRKNPLFGFYNLFYNPYAERAELESIEEFKGEGFWRGIFIILYSITILIIAAIIERIYY